nr:reverse transcriptase domain-containing protein [Tanacetum cinerariifolium]
MMPMTTRSACRTIVAPQGGRTGGQTKGREAAISMTWVDFKVLMSKEFCLNNKMQKLETEFWCHAMVRAIHAAYTDCFHELARLVPHLVTP